MDSFDSAATAFIAELETLGLPLPRDQREAIKARLAIRMRAPFAKAERARLLITQQHPTQEAEADA